jgi:hypothetical protein
MSESGNDVVAATMITGNRSRLSSVAMHYACRELPVLQAIYQKAVINLQDEAKGDWMHPHGYDTGGPGPSPLALDDKKYEGRSPETRFVARRLCPQDEKFQGAFRKLIQKLDYKPYKSSSDQSWITYHNLYTFYTIWAFAMATGVRKIRTPYLPPSEISPINGVATRSWIEQTWGLLYMSAQPNRDLGELAKYLGIELEEARRIIARGNEICSLRSETAGNEFHTAISTNSETMGGVQSARCPRRPDSNGMVIAEQIGMQIKRMMDKPGDEHARILDFWSRNLVPQWTSTMFKSCMSSDGQWFVAPETLHRVDEFLGFLHKLGLTQAQGISSVGPRMSRIMINGIRKLVYLQVRECKWLSEHWRRSSHD